MKIVYMGTPDFAVPSLEALLKTEHEISLVITRPDQQRDRGKKLKPTPVKALAQEKGIPVISPETLKAKDAEGKTIPGKADSEVMDILRKIQPDVIVVAAYGQILPKEILDLPKYGSVNVHGSLLPRWRGAAPVQRAIEAGDRKTGVTIMYMGEELDKGDMLAKAETEIAGKNAGELTDELAALGADLLVPTLEKLERGDVQPEKQSEAESTYARMVFKADGLIDFTKDAGVIEAKVRAMSPWPGAYGFYKGEQFKILEASFPGRETSASGKQNAADCSGNREKSGWPGKQGEPAVPGTILAADKGGVLIAAGEDGKERILATVIQLPGKKALPVSEFFKGNRLETGTVLSTQAEK